MSMQPGLTLRVAALWGESVIATLELGPKTALALNGSGRGAATLPGPENLAGVAALILAPCIGGWRLDGGGATDGFIEVGGTRVSILEERAGTLTNPGDFGVLRYSEEYSVFFQASRRGATLRTLPRPSMLAVLAMTFSALLVVGALALVRALTLPLAANLPPSLLVPAEAPLLMRMSSASSTFAKNPSELPPPQLSDATDTTQQLLQIVAALHGSSSNSESALAATPAPDAASQGIPVWDRSASTARILNSNQGLSEAQVNRVVGAHMDALQACLSSQVARGQIVVRLTLEKDGAVESASLTHSSVGDDSTERCVMREAWRLTMPAATRATTAHLILAMRKK